MKASSSLVRALTVAAALLAVGQISASELNPVTLTWTTLPKNLTPPQPDLAPPVAPKKTPVPEWKPEALGWAGLRLSLTTHQAAMVLEPVVGAPLIVTKARNGLFETWNFDHGACLCFVRDRLDYWSVPSALALPNQLAMR